MKMQLFGTLLAMTLTSASALAAPAQILGCWDGTYAYNVANVLGTELGYEVTLTGSQLGPLSFDEFPEDVKFSGWNEKSLHVLFPRDSCTVSTGKVVCETAGSETSRYANAFAERWVKDLDESKQVLTPLTMSRISFELDVDAGFKVSVHGAAVLDGDDDEFEPSVQEVRIPFDHGGSCDPDNERHHLGGVEFPQRLRTYLSERNR